MKIIYKYILKKYYKFCRKLFKILFYNSDYEIIHKSSHKKCDDYEYIRYTSEHIVSKKEIFHVSFNELDMETYIKWLLIDHILYKLKIDLMSKWKLELILDESKLWDTDIYKYMLKLNLFI